MIFVLEPSENFNQIFLKIEFELHLFAVNGVSSHFFFIWFQQIINHFEGFLIENVKIA